MRKRRPPFALMLATLVAAGALAIALVGRGSGHQPTIRTPTVGIGAARACVRTSAEAVSDDRSAIVINATAQAPVKVTEQATGPRGVATVTRGEVVSARIRADQPVEIKQRAGARASACARAASTDAAHALAVREAFSRALAAAHAHALATKDAAASLRASLRREYHSVAAAAQTAAANRAHHLALEAEASLAARAEAQARSEAGA